MSEPAKGTIHDLGYKRYVGTRRAPSTRWRVIMRHQIAMGWKTWWRFKAWLGMAVIATFIAGGIMYIASNKIFHGMGMPGQVVLTFADVTIPLSMSWFCRCAFIVSLTIGTTVIAGDVQSGAFTFYFARSVRPRDYVLGKLAGIGILVAILTMIGPFLLAILRIGLSESTDQVIDHLVLLPKALAVGALAALAYTAVPLGFSALVSNRRSAQALWAAYYLVGGTIVGMMGMVMGVGWVAALDLPAAITGVALQLFDVNLPTGRLASVPLAAGLVSIFAHAAVAIAIIWYQVSKAQKTGVGGSS
ncbi:MAG: hypothetical protein JWO36_3665 [Myxococcales bacterium]|nr:hypothetical protein [Myxococcales bacterium]